MRPFITHVSILLLTIVSFSCSDDKDDNEELPKTGVNIQFTYTKNYQGVDKFSEEINQLNIYVFNSEGCFIEEYRVNSTDLQQSDNSLDINLDPGTYDFIVWGNLTDSYALCSMEKGRTNFEDCHLSVKCNGNTVNSHPNSLFYGSSYKVEVAPSVTDKQNVSIDLSKNTTAISLTVTGISVEDTEELPYDCKISSTNGRYGFDNSIIKTDEIEYIPDMYINDSEELVADFVIMRVSNKDSDNTKLIISQNEEGQEKEILRESLAEILLMASASGYFETIDQFDIQVEMGVK